MALTPGRLAVVLVLAVSVPGCWLIPDKECFGLRSGLNFIGTYSSHYQLLRRIYDGCTHVMGDLTITWLQDPNIDYDLSFLRHIRYVRDHVAIVANTAVKEIYLPSLELIAGVNGFQHEHWNLSLFVAVNDQLQYLSMPKLREISQGSVYMKKNLKLCGPLHVDWLSIMPRRGVVHIDDVSDSCPGCHGDCPDPRKCWGPFLRDCQKADIGSPACPAHCPSRCFRGPGDVTGCCHEECVFGCSGPDNTQCQGCRRYNLHGACVAHCPPDEPATFRDILTCSAL